MRLTLAIAAALLAGCGSPQTDGGSDLTSSIVGGVPSVADPAVVALVLAPPTCEVDASPVQVHCSGTLIAPRAVLTAAHCVQGLASADLRVYFGNDLASDAGVESAVVSTVAWTRSHPDWEGRINDVALVALGESSAVAPLGMLDQLDPDRVGDLVRVVGFGVDDLGVAGVKRQADARIRGIEIATFSITAAPGMSCDGDSGGPVLVDVGGTEYVAGVTSGGDPTCELGVNGRVDVHRDDFIAEALAEIDNLPPPRVPIDPATNYCESGCDSDLDCPAGMNCMESAAGGSSCALDGFAAGTFTTTCGSSIECIDGICAAAAGCRCYRECDPPSGGGGCSTGKAGRQGGGDGLLMIPVLFALGWLGRTRSAERAHAVRRALATAVILLLLVVAPGCQSSGCPWGTDPGGSVGTQTHCLESNSDVRHGPYVEWWNGSSPPQQKRAGSYLHGALDGTWTTWYATGQVERIVEYRAGKMHGSWVSYHASGKKQEEGEARDGVRVGTWTLWHENGTRERVVDYLQGSNEQRWTSYTETGEAMQSGVFIGGYKEGRFVEYHASGHKAAEGDYRTSKKNGPWIYWGDDEKELRREEWRDGELVSTTPAAG